MDPNAQSKWVFACRHAWRSLIGFARVFCKHPKFALKLIFARARYFFTRQLLSPIATPDQYEIRTVNELVSYWSLFVEGECSHHAWIEALLAHPKPVILDVGANAGLFSHLVWHLNPNAKIHAFDPLPAMVKRISNHAKRIGAAITIHHCAVADHAGQATFYAAAENDPTASLKPINEKQISFSVNVVTLDAVAPTEELLLAKIDVEGLECEVLKGGQETIKRTKFLLLEALTPEALAQVKSSLGTQWDCVSVGATDYLFTRTG